MKRYKTISCIIYAITYTIIPACCLGLLICGYTQLVLTFGKFIPIIAMAVIAVLMFVYKMQKGGKE